MNVLLLSEHFTPKLAGTVSYAKHLMKALAQKEGVKLFFLCPAQGELGEISEHQEGGIKFLKLGVRLNSLPEYSPEERSILINYVKEHLSFLVKEYKIDLVHLLYGFFLAETIDTNFLRNNGVRSVFTVHNIPPEECSISWPTDKTFRYLKDEVRKLGVKWVNQKRLRKQAFDVYLTPSEYVKQQLNQLLPNANVYVTPHGGAELIGKVTSSKQKKRGPFKIATVGGVVPHKQQALIPEIVAYLKEHGVEVEWSIAGPFRNHNYAGFIKNKIESLGVEKQVSLLGSVSEIELERLYVDADVYIQLSKEEGFCMTVLDAIAYGKPIMATPVGAIPEMLECAGGVLLDPDFSNLRKVIKHYLSIIDSIRLKEENLSNFKREYTWSKTAEKVIEAYTK